MISASEAASFWAFAAFEFLLRRLVRCGSAAAPPYTDERTRPLPSSVIAALAYVVMFWAGFKWIGVRSDTPDMCAKAPLFVAAAPS